MSLIRTEMFLKYARMNLREAEAALAEDRPERCTAKVSDAHTALMKAVATALPMVKKDFLSMEERQLLRNIADLSDEEDTARRIVSLLLEVKASCRAGNANAALSAAGQASSLLHDLFKG